MTTSHEDQATDASGGQDGEAAEEKPDIDQLQSEIERTRQDLSETVDALTAKLDVKSRAKERLNVTKDRAAARVSDVQTRATGLAANARNAATDDQGKPTPPVLVGAAVAVAVLVATGVLLWRRRR
jgi:ElaB/YqjD/DUF883 family membrane-anchored ribosome-binding protein